MDRELEKGLRRKAEEELRLRNEEPGAVREADALSLLHELQVHQIELEMQNDELQRAQAELEEALERYTDLFDFAPVGYLTFDEHGRILNINFAGARILGEDRERLIGVMSHAFVTPENQGAFIDLYQRALSTRTKQIGEFKLLRQRKTPFFAFVEVVVLEVDGEDPVQYRTTITDITERKREEEALRKSYEELEKAGRALQEEVAERKQAEEVAGHARSEAEMRTAELESFLAGMADGVILLDTEGNIRLVNDVGLRILGIHSGESLEGWLDRLDVRTLEGESVPREELGILRALLGETSTDMRVKMITPWGKEAVLGISSTPVLDGEGRVIGATMILRDQSARIDLEKERQALLDREQHIADALQGALIPDLSYDIPGLEVATLYEPALREAEVGGDFYDVFLLGEGRIGILIGDVGGKGLPAAISVSAARHSIRSYAYIEPRPGKILALTNDALNRDTGRDGEPCFLTVFFAIMDTRSGEMIFANGGHEPPVVRRADGRVERLNLLGRVLCVAPGYDYMEDAIRLQTGDTVVMVTDGITEARPDPVSLFGMEGIEEYLATHLSASPKEIAEGILQAAKTHGGGTLKDDAAIVVFCLK